MNDNKIQLLRQAGPEIAIDKEFNLKSASDVSSQSVTALGSGSSVNYLTTANSVFYNCPDQAVNDSLVVKFRIDKKSPVIFQAGYILDTGLFDTEILVAEIYLNTDLLFSGSWTTYTGASSQTFEFFKIEELDPIDYELSIKMYNVFSGFSTTTIENVKITAYGQYLINQ